MGGQVNNGPADERPFYWACGKCGSAGLYSDKDFQVGDYAIVCPICGNRYYGDVGGGARAAAPVKVYYSPKSAPPSYASHFIIDRTANILTGPGRIRRRDNQERKESMKRPCANCNRVMSIVRDHFCFVCYHAGEGLSGEEKAAAQAAVKAKIKSGELRRSGHLGGGRKAVPKNPAAETTEPSGTSVRECKRKEGPCFNCGRVMQMQARDACSVCYPAARIKSADERQQALTKIRRKLGVKEFAVAEGPGDGRKTIPEASARKPDAGKGSYPKAADIMRDVRGCLSVIILSDEEMGFIEALRAGRIAIIS